MTSQRQFMKDCKYRIVLDSDILFNILGLRRVYMLQISLHLHILISASALNEIVIRFLCFSELNALR